MKNQVANIYGWLAAIGLLAINVRASNPCVENGPYTNAVACVESGTLIPGVLSPTTYDVAVGQFIFPPTANGYSITNGSELCYVTFDCPESGSNFYITNPIPYTSYTFGNVYFVPPIPPVIWTPGIYTYEAYVIANGSPCSPLTNNLGALTVNVDTNKADVLIDVDFGGGVHSSKTGYAAVGDSPNDLWNYYIAGGYIVSGSLANLITAEGYASPVGLQVTNLPTPSANGSSDPMYEDYLFTNSEVATLTFTNLPTGIWNIYLYATDGNFTLSVGYINYGTKTCYDGSPASTPLAWQEGVQYVVFHNVVVVNGQPVTVTLNPGVNGAAMISGLQIGSVWHAPLPFSSVSSVVAWGLNTHGQTNVPSGLTNTVAIDGGFEHTLALKSDGTVVAWGNNNFGQTNVPYSLANAVAIASGYHHSLALKSDGTVVAWGGDGASETNVPPGLANVVAIAGGGFHSLALKNDGTVVVWGDNYYGQTNIPSGLTNVVAIAGGGHHSLALKNDSTVVAWGDNIYGQTNIPSGLTNVVAIAGGYYHSLALKNDGTVVAWGSNNFGETNVPFGLANVVAIAGGGFYSLVLKSDGTVVAWGDNRYGQTNIPSGLANVVAIAGGQYHSIALVNPNVPPGEITSLYKAGTPGTINYTADSDYDGVSDYQELVDRTNPNDFNSLPNIRLGYWPFDDTNAWVGAEGQLPLLATNVVGVPSWATNAVLIDSVNVPVLKYRDVETNGNANINLRHGTIRFWFKPDWSSTNVGGTGPQDQGRLIEIGVQGTSTGWWTMLLDSNGNTLSFNTQANGASTTNLTTAISWNSNTWHQIVLTYGISNSSLYIDGQAVVTNGLGVQYWPNATERLTGFCIGSDVSGNNQVRGALDELETFNYPLSATEAVDSDHNGLSDWWEFHYFGHLGVDSSADPDGDGFSNQQENQNGTDPTEYYNGVLPNLTIVGGNYQCGPPGSLLPIVLTVQVTNSSGAVLTNAPLSFSTTQGGLASSTNGTTANTLALRTDANGIASVYFVLPLTTNVDCFVNATAWSATNSTSVMFKEHTLRPIISASLSQYTLYLKPNGHVLTWGWEDLGGSAGFDDETNVPTEIPGLTNIVQISAGEEHALARSVGGQIWAWGNNNRDQVGNGTTSGYQLTPVSVSGLTNVIDIAAGGFNSLALEADGTVWAWGDVFQTNYYHPTLFNDPIQIAGVSNAVAVAGGDEHSLVLLADGTVRGWGDNEYGQLGIGDGSYGSQGSPVQVINLVNIVSIAAGYEHSLALQSNGAVWAWGGDYDGQLGDGVSGTYTDVPVRTIGLSNVVQIAVGGYYSIAVDALGHVWTWGYNDAGQLGTGDYQDTHQPVEVENASDIVMASAGWSFSVALKSDGRMSAWGAYYGADPELGNAATYTSNNPDNTKPYSVFYNVIEPTIQVIQGNYQSGLYSEYIPQPLIFRVLDQANVPLSNVPVYLRITQGDLLISANLGGEQYSDMRLDTDTNGMVVFFAYAYDKINTSGLIDVYAASPEGGLGVKTNFQEKIVSLPALNVVMTNDGMACIISWQQAEAERIVSVITGILYPDVDSLLLTDTYADGFAAQLTGSLDSEPEGINITKLPQPTITPNGGYLNFPTNVVLTLGLENLTNLVAGLYKTELGRAGSPSELETVITLAQGLRDEDYNDENIRSNLINGLFFRNSDEYITDYGAPGDLYVANTNYSIEYSLDSGDNWNTYTSPIQITNSVVLLAKVKKTGTSDSRTHYAYLTSDPSQVHFDYIPDSWLVQYFGAYYQNNTNAAPDADPDHDGLSNLQEYEMGTDPNVSNIRLGYWRFDTTEWVGEQGQEPLRFTNLVSVPDWSSNALEIDNYNPAFLAYHYIEGGGSTNITPQSGTIWFWFKPNWNSGTTNNGTGPASQGRLIEMGSQNTSDGWWALTFNTNGTQLNFVTQTNGIAVTNIEAMINWTSNQWHQVMLAYGPSSSSLYIDGQAIVTNGMGVSYWPDASAMANGFYIGSDNTGNNQAKGQFDELQTFNFPLNDNNHNGLPDWWEIQFFGDFNQPTNGDYDGDGTNNLQEYLSGTDPNKITFSISFINQDVSNSIVTGTVTVFGGVASYYAVLVDSTNFSAATWNSYTSSNLTVNLGSTQGAHDVWLGLRGLPADAHQTWEEATLVLDMNSPTISITNPVNNASFNALRVNVSGNFTTASLKDITVNGIPAFISGTNFNALNVPLAPGTNIIQAIVEGFTGATNTASVIVIGLTNTDGSMNDLVQIQAAPIAGFSPLTVAFQIISNNAPGTFQQAFYDFNGDGIVDLVTNNLFPLTYTYATNGEYFPVVTIQTTAGFFSSSGGWNSSDPNRVQINVQAPPTQTTFASINNPVDLKWAGTNLYVLSGSDATITEFNTNGSTVRTLSNLGTNPTGFDVDGAGNVYVAVTSSNQVWKFFPTNSSFQADTKFSGGGYIGNVDGSAGSAINQFNAPFDVAVSPDASQISVSDFGNNRVQQFSATNGSFIATFGSNGSEIGQLNEPKGLTYDSVGYLYIVDSGNNRVALALGSMVIGVSGTNGTALGCFIAPVGISVSERGIYVVDTGNDRIQTLNPIVPLQAPTPFTLRSVLSTNFNQPAAVAAVDDPMTEQFYVADTGTNRVVLYSLASDDPTPVWKGMTNRIAAGDISGATSYFSIVSADKYRQAFLSAGTITTISAINQIGTLTVDYVGGNEAESYFTETNAGQTITFSVHFVKENGVWKILEF